MVTEEERQWMWSEYAPDPRMRLNLGIRRRLTPLLDNDHKKILLTNAILYSLPGALIIYYGDEIGMGDNIWLFDRNGVRTPMQWDDSLNAGFSDASPDKLFAPVIDSQEFSYKKVNVKNEKEDPYSLLNKMRHLIKVRKSHPIFALGESEFLAKEQSECLMILRSYQNRDLLCVLNLTSSIQHPTVDLSKFEGRSMLDILSNRELGKVQSKETSVVLNPYEFKWVLLS
jgi:maltose alpha-D-glucosyltransferase/alpha-amylase